MSIRSWLGLAQVDAPEHAPLREVVSALDRLEPERARHIARFAYLLGRVAHADRHVTPEETTTMERSVEERGGLTRDQAMLVVSLAKSSNLLFGSTADYEVAREFADKASYDEKLSLARCLFATAATDEAISMVEETEIHRILTQLRIQPSDLTALRVEHQKFLPGLAPRRGGSAS
jgi:uncharacterized tellurite resistance protein B-like protein